MTWFQTVALLITFSAVLGIIMSLVYHLISDSKNSRKGDCLFTSTQDLTDMPKKQAMIAMFLMPDKIPGHDVITRAFVFADAGRDGRVSLGYAIEYARNDTSTLTKQVSYLLEEGTFTADETQAKVSRMDDLLMELSNRCGFNRAEPMTSSK